jgi:CDP-4-dehydro-6-deoxyglucose reductase, E3
VLDCLLRHGVDVPHSCKSGVCHSCLMLAGEGELPAKAQNGLKDTLRARRYFLACVCQPESELHVYLAGDELRVPATIQSIDDVGGSVLRVRLKADRSLEHRAGQYLTLLRADGLGRSYSIASLANEEQIELHVRLIPGGAMSGWLKTDARVGERVSLQGPSGDCFYVAGNPAERLLLAGTGTGLAPLYGIVKDALSQGHRGPITLYHGVRTREGAYFTRELLELTRAHPNLAVHLCVLDGEVPDGALAGALDAVVLQREKDLAAARVYLCGDPTLVQGLRRKLFLAGAASKKIYADAFIPSAPRVAVAEKR